MIASISGFRGIAGEDFDVHEAYRLGRRFGHFIGPGRCIVGRDTRRSGGELASSVMAGLMEAGCTVFDLGVTSTPSIFRMVRVLGCEGGASITASHNPPEWNGFKPIVRPGRGLFQGEFEEFHAQAEPPGTITTSRLGSSEVISSTYVEDILKMVGEDSCRGLDVALDPGGGAGCLLAPELFSRLGCRVLTVNSTPGVFSRMMDPTYADLSELSALVKQGGGCQVGFAYDCDADRLVVMDRQGRRMEADGGLLICLDRLLKEGVKGDLNVAVSVDTSLAVERIASRHGGRVFYTRVGEANVVEEILAHDCVFGGEGSSGGVILPSFNLCRDGLLASAIIAKSIVEEGGLEPLLERIPRYARRRGRIECEKSLAEAVVQKLYEQERDADTVDGVKVRKDEDTWILVRASGTEDSLRISVESKREREAERLYRDYEGRLRRLIGA